MGNRAAESMVLSNNITFICLRRASFNYRNLLTHFFNLLESSGGEGEAATNF